MKLASLCLLSGGAWAQVIAEFGSKITGKQGLRGQRIPTLLVLILLAVGITAVQAAIPASERTVLLNLYTTANGGTWTVRENWNGAAGTECRWRGVSCNDSGTTITGIGLSGNNLTGSLPALTGLTNFADLRGLGEPADRGILGLMLRVSGVMSNVSKV